MALVTRTRANRRTRFSFFTLKKHRTPAAHCQSARFSCATFCATAGAFLAQFPGLLRVNWLRQRGSLTYCRAASYCRVMSGKYRHCLLCVIYLLYPGGGARRPTGRPALSGASPFEDRLTRHAPSSRGASSRSGQADTKSACAARRFLRRSRIPRSCRCV